MDPFQYEALYWYTGIYTLLLSSDFRFTSHIKLVFWTRQNKIFQYSLCQFRVEITFCYYFLFTFYCCKSFIYILSTLSTMSYRVSLRKAVPLRRLMLFVKVWINIK